MYQEHFGLREPPFRITPRAEIFFAGGKRGDTLEALLYAVTHDEGMVKVSGETGSGKTMLCQALIHWLPDGFTPVHLPSPPLSREELLHGIADELGLPIAGNRVGRLVRALQERLGELQAEDRHVVLLLDEAHTIPDEALEQLRQLSNLEANRRKLLRIVIFGQPELDLRLMQTDMRQFRERITHNFALEPLSEEDVAANLAFRMRAAGHQGASPFSATASQLIARHSAGLIRRVDVLADKALHAAYAAGSQQIEQNNAKTAVREANFPPIQGAGYPVPKWVGLTATGLALTGIVAGMATMYFANSSQHALSPMAQSPTETVAAAFAAAASTTPTAPEDDEATTPPEPEKAGEKTPEKPEVPEAPGMPLAAAPASIVPAPADASPTAGQSEAPTGTPTATQPDAQPARFGPLTSTLLASSAGWLREAPGTRHFIQLTQVNAAQSEAIENFLTTHTKRLDPAHPVRVYLSALSGRERLGVIYGDFATANEAAEALNRLPADLRALGPYVRTVSKLR